MTKMITTPTTTFPFSQYRPVFSLVSMRIMSILILMRMMLLVAMIVVLATMVDASFGTMSHLRLPPSSPLSYRTSERKFGFCSSTTFVHPTRQRQPVMATFSDDSGTTTTLATANTTTSITSTATATANRPPLSVPHPRPPSMWWLDVMSPTRYQPNKCRH